MTVVGKAEHRHAPSWRSPGTQFGPQQSLRQRSQQRSQQSLQHSPPTKRLHRHPVYCAAPFPGPL